MEGYSVIVKHLRIIFLSHIFHTETRIFQSWLRDLENPLETFKINSIWTRRLPDGFEILTPNIYENLKTFKKL